MPATASSREVRLPTTEGWLLGDLVLPDGFGAIVLVVDAMGRHNAVNRRIAHCLHARGIATLLPDLLTAGEQESDLRGSHHRFDVPLLTRRAQEASSWIGTEPPLCEAMLGLLATGCGSAAALIAAARLGKGVAAIVCRGGRPDLAGPAALAAVRAPTLLLAGSRDNDALAHGAAASQQLNCERSLAAVPGAGPQFDEAAALEVAAEMAADWFSAHFMALEEMAP